MKLLREIGLNVILLSVFAAGCVTVTWTKIGGQIFSNDEKYEVELPQGWRRFVPAREDLAVTRDGLMLQSVRVGRWPVEKDPPHTKRKMAKGMLPEEAAELVIDDFRSDNSISNFQVVYNGPAEVGGHRGFKLVYTYQTKDNLRKQGIYYGVLVDGWLYFLSYKAPARYYLGRDEATFENIKNTFKITM